MLLEQRRQAKGLVAKQLRGDAGVKDVARSPAVVLTQEAQIVVGVVKDNLDLRTLHQRPQ